MTLALPPLPYAYDALAPHISKETLEFHHGKHHRAYVDNVNRLVKDTTLAGLSLDQLMKKAAGGRNETARRHHLQECPRQLDLHRSAPSIDLTDINGRFKSFVKYMRRGKS